MTALSLAGIFGLGIGLGIAGPPTPPSAGKADRERMVLEDVFGTPGGEHIVILRTYRAPRRYLPIAIGESEALALQLKLDRRSPPRPLTLHLLEAVLLAADVTLIEISIDDQRDGVFIGRVRLRQGDRRFDVDARPSDALGLAAGRSVPIWVSRRVLAEAGMGEREIAPRGAPDMTDAYEDTL